MNQLTRSIFEKLSAHIRAEEVAEIAKLTNDAASKGVLYNGVYFRKLYEAREKTLHLVAMALIDAYKQAETVPTEAIVREAKEDIETTVDAEIKRILEITRSSYAQLANSSGLHGELVSNSEAARRSVLKDAFREIDIWTNLYKKQEAKNNEDTTRGEKDFFEVEILHKAFNAGSIQSLCILSADQIPGEWLRIGNEDFLRKDNPVFHYQYRDAFDRLIAKGHIKWESGKLYRLTAEGISAAQNIAFSQPSTDNEKQVGNLTNETTNRSTSRKFLSWKNPFVRYVFAPIFVGVILYHLNGGGKPTQNSITTSQLNVSGDQITAENITINKYEKPIVANTGGSRNTNISKAKLKINRIFDDYSNAIKALKSSYAEDSGKISSEAASRGIYESSIHVGSHIKLAIKIKQSLTSEKLNVDRKIEDILMESLNKTSLASSGPEFDYENKRSLEAQKAYDEFCAFLNISTKDKEFKILGEGKITKDFDVTKY